MAAASSRPVRLPALGFRVGFYGLGLWQCAPGNRERRRSGGGQQQACQVACLAGRALDHLAKGDQRQVLAGGGVVHRRRVDDDLGANICRKNAAPQAPQIVSASQWPSSWLIIGARASSVAGVNVQWQALTSQFSGSP